MAVRNLQFVLSGSDKSASRALDKVGAKADGLGKKLAGVGKAAAFGVGGVAVAAVGGLAAAMVNGIRDAAEYQTLAAQTAAVIKSTGGEANVTAKGVQKLAGELESLSGIDEVAIVNAQNLLLTFTKVRNEVGEGNDVFDQATKTLVDMSAALGQDTKASAIQLGKALNDPIKGVTALSKVGVSFTKQQKQQIKTLVESGRTMDAQKVILKELQVEFGGAAKAAGSGLEGSVARAKDAFGDLFRSIATPLLPKIAEWAEGFSVTVNEKVAPAIMRWVDQFERGVGPGGEFRDNLRDLAQGAKDAWPEIQNAYEKTKQVVDFVTEHKDAFKTITAGVVGYRTAMKSAAIWSATMGANGPKAAAGITAAGSAAQINTPKVAGFATAFSRLLGPVTAFAAIYATSEGVRKVVNGELGELGSGIKKIVTGKDAGEGWKEILGLNDFPGLPGQDVPGKQKPVGSVPLGTRTGGSSQDRPAPVPTRSFPRNGQMEFVMRPQLGQRELANATTGYRGGRLVRGYVPAY